MPTVQRMRALRPVAAANTWRSVAGRIAGRVRSIAAITQADDLRRGLLRRAFMRFTGSLRTQDGVGERRPGLERPGPEVEAGQADQRRVGLGVDPEEGAAAAEVRSEEHTSELQS